MTGFGASHLRTEDVVVSTEIKTVNNRFLKVSLRLSDGYTFLEQSIENVIREKISRGSVNVYIRIIPDAKIEESRINEPLLKTYFNQIRFLGQSLGVNESPALESLLSLPGVVQDTKIHSPEHRKQLEKAVLQSVNAAIVELQEMRKSEGESMRKDLAENLGLLSQEITAVEKQAPVVIKQYRQKLSERIGKVMHENNLMLDMADLVREMAIFVDKSDISEEIVRFRSHIVQFETILGNEECCGRKLDFLTQEMFRESNTIGSKSNDACITTHVIELKTIIERMREMLQNVE